MGICESKNNPPINIDQTKFSDNRIDEVMIEQKEFEKSEPELSKYICKINIETASKRIFGTGFFLKFLIDGELF